MTTTETFPLTVEITARDVRRGVPLSYGYCALSHAIQRALLSTPEAAIGWRVAVHRVAVCLYRHAGKMELQRWAFLPAEAIEFASAEACGRADQDAPPAPFTLEFTPREGGPARG